MTARTTWTTMATVLLAMTVAGCGAAKGKADDPSGEQEQRPGTAHISAELKGTTIVATETQEVMCRARSKRYSPWKPCGTKPKVGEPLIVRMNTPTPLEGTTDADGQVTFDLAPVEATPELVANQKAMVIEKSRANAPLAMPSATVDLSSCSLLSAWKDAVAVKKGDADSKREAEQKAKKDACDKGDGASCFALAQMIRVGNMGDGGMEASLPIYRKACELKHKPACKVLEQAADIEATKKASAAAGPSSSGVAPTFAGKTTSGGNGVFRRLVAVPAKSTVTVKVTTSEDGTWAKPLLLQCRLIRADLKGGIDLQQGNPCVVSVSNTGPFDQNVELNVFSCDGIDQIDKKCRPVGHPIDFSAWVTTQ